MAVEFPESRIREIKERHEPELLAAPGVVGVGIGELRGPSGQVRLCIRIYVEKRDEETLRGLPASIEGIPTGIEEVGKPSLR
ncbi:MAG: hypothetical protein V3V06_03240 [Dehalococcoidia bacterium]